MDTFFSTTAFRTIAQASTEYGSEQYGTQVYSCDAATADCSVANNGGETGGGTGTGGTVVPNTGFMGMSQDTAILAVGGGALLFIALVLAIVFTASKSRQRKQNAKGE